MKISKPIKMSLINTNVTDNTPFLTDLEVSDFQLGVRFQKDSKIYSFNWDELPKNLISSTKFIEEGSLRIREDWISPKYDLELWRKTTNKDRLPLDTYEFIVDRDELPVRRLDPQADGSFISTSIEEKQIEVIGGGGLKPHLLKVVEYLDSSGTRVKRDWYEY